MKWLAAKQNANLEHNIKSMFIIQNTSNFTVSQFPYELQFCQSRNIAWSDGERAETTTQTKQASVVVELPMQSRGVEKLQWPSPCANNCRRNSFCMAGTGGGSINWAWQRAGKSLLPLGHGLWWLVLEQQSRSDFSFVYFSYKERQKALQDHVNLVFSAAAGSFSYSTVPWLQLAAHWLVFGS